MKICAIILSAGKSKRFNSEKPKFIHSISGKQLIDFNLEALEKNKNINLTISTAKPPIFWKEKETTKRQIQNWNPQKLRLLIYKINELELVIKKNFNNSLNIIIDFLLAQSVSKTNN